MTDKKHILARAGLRQYENELQSLKIMKRKEAAQKIKGAKERGDLSESAEYDTAKDKQRNTELHIRKLERLLRDVEVVVKDEVDLDKVNIGYKVKLLDVKYDGEMEFYIVDSTEANSLRNRIDNKSLVGRALIGKAAEGCIDVETQVGDIQYKVLRIQRVS